jgi:hypothetical protein
MLVSENGERRHRTEDTEVKTEDTEEMKVWRITSALFRLPADLNVAGSKKNKRTLESPPQKPPCPPCPPCDAPFSSDIRSALLKATGQPARGDAQKKQTAHSNRPLKKPPCPSFPSVSSVTCPFSSDIRAALKIPGKREFRPGVPRSRLRGEPGAPVQEAAAGKGRGSFPRATLYSPRYSVSPPVRPAAYPAPMPSRY